MSDFVDTTICEITEHELPLACPLPQTTLWSAHPRVYLAIETTGEAICPYCGVHYVLKKAG